MEGQSCERGESSKSLMQAGGGRFSGRREGCDNECENHVNEHKSTDWGFLRVQEVVVF